MTYNPSRMLKGAGLLLISLALAACAPKDDSKTKIVETPASDVKPRQIKVRATLPQYGLLASGRNVSVTLEPRRKSGVTSKASGQVQQILVAEGDRVTAGQVVMQLDNSALQNQLSDVKLALESSRLNLKKAQNSQGGNLGVARQNVDSAQANTDLANRRYREGKQLFAAGGISSVDLQQFKVNADQATSSLQNASDQLARAGRAQGEDIALLKVQVQQAQNRLDNAERSLNDSSIKAPFAGVISDLPVNQGEFLGAGSRAFVLADVSSLEAKFKLPPDQADSLTLGSSSELKLTYNGISFPAKLERRTTIPGADRQVQLSAVSSSADIPVGATATLSYQLRVAKGMILPSSAVRLVAGVSTVFLTQGGKAVPQVVKILGEAEGKMALEGLPKYVSVVYPLPNEITGGEALEVIK